MVGFNLVPAARSAKPHSRQIFTDGRHRRAGARHLHGRRRPRRLDEGEWQGGDQAGTDEQPFWNYVPFQTTSAGLDDDPAAWPPVLAAGFDLTELATPPRPGGVRELAARATSRRTRSPRPTSRRGPLPAGPTPLEAQIETLTADKTALTGEVDTLTKENDSLKATVFQTSPLQSQVAALTQQVADGERAGRSADGQGRADEAHARRRHRVRHEGQRHRPAAEHGHRPPVDQRGAGPQARAALGRARHARRRRPPPTAPPTLTLKLSRAAQEGAASVQPAVTAEAISGDRIATAKSKLDPLQEHEMMRITRLTTALAARRRDQRGRGRGRVRPHRGQVDLSRQGEDREHADHAASA